MDAAPDYSKCSLRELRDVAARINRTKYPERYALVLRAIARHEADGEASIEVGAASAKKPLVWNGFAESIYVLTGAIIGALLGIVWLSITSAEINPDSPNGIAEVVSAFILGALVAEIGVKVMRRTKKIRKR